MTRPASINTPTRERFPTRTRGGRCKSNPPCAFTYCFNFRTSQCIADMMHELVERFFDLGFAHTQSPGSEVDPRYRVERVAYDQFHSGHVFSVSATEWTPELQENTRRLLEETQSSLRKEGRELVFHSFHPVDDPSGPRHRPSGGWVVLVRGLKNQHAV